MKKIKARDFQKAFGKVSDHLKAGESVQVTKHGKAVGVFIKSAKPSRQMPDFMANLAGRSKTVGNRLLCEFMDESLH
jgi:antitoxin (DNA-binding transcriptional repressor) of toxin-antitoxin stability system